MTSWLEGKLYILEKNLGIYEKFMNSVPANGFIFKQGI